ncbi:MAG TPA: pseudouridine-5'-phosphate glycosidase [Anaerolineales bacterium]|nr:pseudouridine-5'-phosphate glycosidase [Anaerolineales bacterium]
MKRSPRRPTGSKHVSLLDSLDVRPSIQRALERGHPVVALESTVLTHGIPRPTNFDIAREVEDQVRRAGATPATIAVLDGRFVVGLDGEELEQVCRRPDMRKLNRRDLAPAVALHWSGGTTVSATMLVAEAAGIRVFATGGIGGVHRGGTGDVSSDLTELARTPVAVVCSGAKAILDLPRTLEWLETAGIPVVGWKTDAFPEFFSLGGQFPVSARVDSAVEAARLIEAQAETGCGMLLCVPCPREEAVPSETVAGALEAAESQAAAASVTGKELSPFLLARLVELTGGATLRANLALLRNNAAVAAEIAIGLVS